MKKSNKRYFESIDDNNVYIDGDEIRFHPKRAKNKICLKNYVDDIMNGQKENELYDIFQLFIEICKNLKKLDDKNMFNTFYVDKNFIEYYITNTCVIKLNHYIDVEFPVLCLNEYENNNNNNRDEPLKLDVIYYCLLIFHRLFVKNEKFIYDVLKINLSIQKSNVYEKIYFFFLNVYYKCDYLVLDNNFQENHVIKSMNELIELLDDITNDKRFQTFQWYIKKDTTQYLKSHLFEIVFQNAQHMELIDRKFKYISGIDSRLINDLFCVPNKIFFDLKSGTFYFVLQAEYKYVLKCLYDINNHEDFQKITKIQNTIHLIDKLNIFIEKIILLIENNVVIPKWLIIKNACINVILDNPTGTNNNNLDEKTSKIHFVLFKNIEKYLPNDMIKLLKHFDKKLDHKSFNYLEIICLLISFVDILYYDHYITLVKLSEIVNSIILNNKFILHGWKGCDNFKSVIYQLFEKIMQLEKNKNNNNNNYYKNRDNNSNCLIDIKNLIPGSTSNSGIIIPIFSNELSKNINNQKVYFNNLKHISLFSYQFLECIFRWSKSNSLMNDIYLLTKSNDFICQSDEIYTFNSITIDPFIELQLYTNWKNNPKYYKKIIDVFIQSFSNHNTKNKIGVIRTISSIKTTFITHNLQDIGTGKGLTQEGLMMIRDAINSTQLFQHPLLINTNEDSNNNKQKKPVDPIYFYCLGIFINICIYNDFTMDLKLPKVLYKIMDIGPDNYRPSIEDLFDIDKQLSFKYFETLHSNDETIKSFDLTIIDDYSKKEINVDSSNIKTYIENEIFQKIIKDGWGYNNLFMLHKGFHITRTDFSPTYINVFSNLTHSIVENFDDFIKFLVAKEKSFLFQNKNYKHTTKCLSHKINNNFVCINNLGKTFYSCPYSRLTTWIKKNIHNPIIKKFLIFCTSYDNLKYDDDLIIDCIEDPKPIANSLPFARTCIKELTIFVKRKNFFIKSFTKEDDLVQKEFEKNLEYSILNSICYGIV